MLLPAAIRWLISLKEAGIETLTAETAGLVDEFVETIFALEFVNADENHPEEPRSMPSTARSTSRARHGDERAVCAVADKLEKIVPDDLPAAPKYSEYSFIK